ncbi:MAG: hypothetical protein ACFBSE_04500 [Prochloraceae cyanobacterium]
MTLFIYDDLPTLLELIKRLLNQLGEKRQIISGKLPEEFPQEIPFPQEAEIIGSVVNANNSIQIYFDVRFTAKQLVDFYLKNIDKNWQKLELLETRRKGFTRNRIRSRLSSNYRQTQFLNKSLEKRFQLNIENRERTSNKIKASLTLYPDNIADISTPPMPILITPANINLLRASSSKGSENYNSIAELKTNIDLESLIEHYGNFFAEEGWIKIKQEKDKNSAWQNWKKQDEKGQVWLGMLTIAKTNTTGDRYLANASVSKEEA